MTDEDVPPEYRDPRKRLEIAEQIQLEVPLLPEAPLPEVPPPPPEAPAQELPPPYLRRD